MNRQTATNIGWGTTAIAFMVNPVAGVCMGAMNYLTDRESKKWEPQPIAPSYRGNDGTHMAVTRQSETHVWLQGNGNTLIIHKADLQQAVANGAVTPIW